MIQSFNTLDLLLSYDRKFYNSFIVFETSTIKFKDHRYVTWNGIVRSDKERVVL